MSTIIMLHDYVIDMRLKIYLIKI